MVAGDYFAELLKQRKFEYYDKKSKRMKKPDYRKYIPLILEFAEYLDKCNKKTMICNYYEGIEKKAVIIPYHNRYSKNYVDSIYARLKKLEKWSKEEYKGKITMMTLTVAQKNKSISQCLDDLQEAKTNLFMNLRQIRKEIGFLEYIWIIEPHKSGYPHCHVILFTHADIKEFEPRLQKLWAKKYQAGSLAHGLKIGSDESDYKNQDSYEQIEYLAQYIFKYLAKTLMMGLNPAYMIFHAEVWKKYKPVKNWREVEKMPDGSYRLHSVGSGAYRLWDSSRQLKEVMKYEKQEDFKNVIDFKMLSDNPSDTFNTDKYLYQSQNIDLLEAIMFRSLN